MNVDEKILNKILAKQFNGTLDRLCAMVKRDLSLGCTDSLTYKNQSM